jgi:2'-5' RNA ligase
VTATDRIRLFAAVDLPAAVRAAIGEWGRAALRDRGDVRLLRDDALHVTLCFLGARPASELAMIAAACRAVAGSGSAVGSGSGSAVGSGSGSAVGSGSGSAVGSGSRPGSRSGAVAESMARSGVELALGEVLWLPPRRPHALAIGLVDRDRQLGAVQAALAGALAAAGVYEPEARPFRPHVTVARPRGRSLARTELAAPPPLAFVVLSLSLYRSRTEPGGARYEALETVAL